jgi:hypothetical protein
MHLIPTYCIFIHTYIYRRAVYPKQLNRDWNTPLTRVLKLHEAMDFRTSRLCTEFGSILWVKKYLWKNGRKSCLVLKSKTIVACMYYLHKMETFRVCILHVCTWVCMYLGMYVPGYVCTWVCMHLGMHVHKYVCSTH